MPDTSSNEAPPFRRAGRWLAVLAWCMLIFAASSRPDLRVSDDDLLDLVLRKLAHLGAFGALAVLAWWALDAGAKRWSRATMIGAWLLAVAYAATDEWHQTFVPGRVGHASDVLIDAIGATIALVAARRFLRARRRPRSTPTAPTEVPR